MESKEWKERMRIVNHQTENVSKETEITKGIKQKFWDCKFNNFSEKFRRKARWEIGDAEEMLTDLKCGLQSSKVKQRKENKESKRLLGIRSLSSTQISSVWTCFCHSSVGTLYFSMWARFSYRSQLSELATSKSGGQLKRKTSSKLERE